MLHYTVCTTNDALGRRPYMTNSGTYNDTEIGISWIHGVGGKRHIT
jgi:hypothetical protein